MLSDSGADPINTRSKIPLAELTTGANVGIDSQLFDRSRQQGVVASQRPEYSGKKYLDDVTCSQLGRSSHS